MKRKKLTALLMILVMVLNLVACGAKEEPVAVEEPKAEETPSVDAQKPSESTEQGKVKQFTVTIKMIGDMAELRTVSAFLKAHNVNYEILEQKEVM